MAGSLSANQLQRHATWHCCTRQEDFFLPEPRELARTSVWQILGNADYRNQSKATNPYRTMSIVPFDSLPRMRTPSDVRLLDANSQLCIPARFSQTSRKLKLSCQLQCQGGAVTWLTYGEECMTYGVQRGSATPFVKIKILYALCIVSPVVCTRYTFVIF